MYADDNQQVLRRLIKYGIHVSLKNLVGYGYFQ